MNTLQDPRLFPLSNAEPAADCRQWHDWAEQSLSSPSRHESAELDSQLEKAMTAAFVERRFEAIVHALEGATSAPLYRHLWRAGVAAWRARMGASAASVVAYGFAIPVVIVAAAEAQTELRATLGDPQSIVESMQEHAALGGNHNFGIAGVLAGIAAVGLDAAARWPDPADPALNAQWVEGSEAAPITIAPAREGAHLRFLVGSALASPHAMLFEARSAGGWGMPVARNLSGQLAAPEVQLLALPGAPSDIVAAWQQGLLAQREVGLQLFASAAIRNLRAAFGEPGAVISAHRTDPGELRISLSSPFGERDAEGFRCPLYPFERIDDVLKMIVELLEACRVTDVRVLPGIHPDRDARTGLPLFFRADLVAPG